MSTYLFLLIYILINSASFSISQNSFEDLVEDDLSHSKKDTYGRLTGDVQNWAAIIQNYILQSANDLINRDLTQELFDLANYTVEAKSGEDVVKEVKETLSNYFSQKQEAAKLIANKAIELYDKYLFLKNDTWKNIETLYDLSTNYYRDSDVPNLLPVNMQFSPYFKQKVSFDESIIKISDEIPRNDPDTIMTVRFTKELDQVFKNNIKKDHSLRWQYFGSSLGLMRLYPAREWDTNFAGFYNDYDPRVRNWYIAATSGPKDVIIVIDCSLSMKGKKFDIAKSVAKAVIDTLTSHDYVNVICARSSHWDEVGKSQIYQTEVLSCQQNRVVQATLAHRRDLKEKVTELIAGGTTELEAFELAFELLNSNQRTACQSLIVFITDGADSDGETVRCGEGYYTRSGYVSGPICIYNWTKVWESSLTLNKKLIPKARIFSYLTIDDGEELPGYLACQNHGSFKKLTDGENLISKMSNYYEFLSSSTFSKEQGLWTSPYIDSGGLGLTITFAIPAISKKNKKLIGVAAVDATLEEIENLLTSHQWGDVYSFLINKQGEAIFHPALSANARQNIMEDPIAVPINKLEQDNYGNPKLFNQLLREMIDGKEGKLRIENANRLLPKRNVQPATYYYASLIGSDYSFAYSLSDTDMSFREISEPSDLSKYKKSYFNLLIEYNSTKARNELPNEFEILQVKINETKYPGLRVSYPYSSIFFAPNVYCDPNSYFYDDDLSAKTVDAHNYINSHIFNKSFIDLGCDSDSKYKKGTRAYVLLSQPIESYWNRRPAESVKEVKWTYVGMRTGVFRTYPGHRSNRLYNPVSRSWYKRALNSHTKTTLSSPYLDAAGAGKIITISQAVFEGMQNVTKSFCENVKSLKKPSGCHCLRGEDCESGVCYVSKAIGTDVNLPRCATNRLIGVTGTDLGYNDFQTKIMEKMKSSDNIKSCGHKYKCSDTSFECETRCYLFDTNAILIVAPEFINEKDLEEKKYSQVNLGIVEGEIMKDLIYKHRFLMRNENIDFSGTCTISPYQPKVTLEGIPINPEDQDNYYKNRGPIPSFQNEYGCIQDAVRYAVNQSVLGEYQNKILIGNVTGPCMSGFYYVAALPKTNLFLLVIENWRDDKEKYFFNFNCRITRNIVNSGNFQLINGTCAHQDLTSKTMREENRCPVQRNIQLPCNFNRSFNIKFNLSLFHLCIFLSILNLK